MTFTPALDQIQCECRRRGLDMLDGEYSWAVADDCEGVHIECRFEDGTVLEGYAAHGMDHVLEVIQRDEAWGEAEGTQMEPRNLVEAYCYFCSVIYAESVKRELEFLDVQVYFLERHQKFVVLGRFENFTEIMASFDHIPDFGNGAWIDLSDIASVERFFEHGAICMIAIAAERRNGVIDKAEASAQAGQALVEMVSSAAVNPGVRDTGG